jgi:hypothetical protein
VASLIKGRPLRNAPIFKEGEGIPKKLVDQLFRKLALIL